MSGSRDLVDSLSQNIGLGLIDHVAVSRAPGILKGPAAMAGNAVLAASDLLGSGRVSNSTMMGTAASAAAMVGSRMIPGVGWAMLAYTAADLGSRAVLGKPFGETWIGQPIDWAAGQAGRGALGLATRATDAVGWTGGSDFLKNTIAPWAFEGDAKSQTGFVAGPSTVMGPDDWYEHPPSHHQHRDLDDPSLTTIAPDGEDIQERREKALSADAFEMDRIAKSDELGVPSNGMTSKDLLRAALDLADIDDQDTPRRSRARSEPEMDL